MNDDSAPVEVGQASGKKGLIKSPVPLEKSPIPLLASLQASSKRALMKSPMPPKKSFTDAK